MSRRRDSSPSDPPAWDELERELLHDCRVFTVSRSHARSPHTGAAHPFYRIDSSDWVNIVALTRDEQVVLVRQYRHGQREVTLEIPGGIVDPGESGARAAARELLEETGYHAEGVRRIGVVNPNPALFGNRTETYLAEGVERVSAIANGATEETIVELVPLARLRADVAAGRVSSALVIAALYWFEASRRGDVPP